MEATDYESDVGELETARKALWVVGGTRLRVRYRGVGDSSQGLVGGRMQQIISRMGGL